LNPRPAILFSVLLVILLPFYFYVDRAKLHDIQVTDQKKANLLDLKGVDGITLSRGTEKIHFQKTGDGKLFQVTTPVGAFVPQDLLTALSGLYLKSEEVEIIAEGGELSQYGLDRPVMVAEVTSPGKAAPIRLSFGNENPTHTATYAKLDNSPQIFLLGMDMKYYQDLIFEWLEGKQGKPKTS
jgi:hypothetical protein